MNSKILNEKSLNSILILIMIIMKEKINRGRLYVSIYYKINLRGVILTVYVEVFLHGYPDCAASWRYTMSALSKQGFHCLG